MGRVLPTAWCCERSTKQKGQTLAAGTLRGWRFWERIVSHSFFAPHSCRRPLRSPAYRVLLTQLARHLLGGWLHKPHHPAMSSDKEQEFLQLAEGLMQSLLMQLDTFDPDEVEADSAAGVIKLAFADGGICVLNRQTAAHQMWLAEGATAWHFDHDVATGRWMDTKGRGSLKDVLSEVLSKRIGRNIKL